MAINQAYLFLIFTVNGILIGLLFDFFRILRKTIKTVNMVTYIEDILFWILTGISIIFFMYKFSDGSLRLFMLLGLCFGIIVYMLTLSNLIIKTVIYIIEILKKIIHTIIKIVKVPLKVIYNIIDKIIFRPLYIFYIKLNAIMTKKLKNIKYKQKSLKKLEKNVKNL